MLALPMYGGIKDQLQIRRLQEENSGLRHRIAELTRPESKGLLAEKDDATEGERPTGCTDQAKATATDHPSKHSTRQNSS